MRFRTWSVRCQHNLTRASCRSYVGDYDYGSAIAFKHVTSWADGRVTISGQSQQDAFTDRELVGFAVTTADPACGSLVIGTAPTDFTST